MLNFTGINVLITLYSTIFPCGEYDYNLTKLGVAGVVSIGNKFLQVGVVIAIPNWFRIQSCFLRLVANPV